MPRCRALREKKRINERMIRFCTSVLIVAYLDALLDWFLYIIHDYLGIFEVYVDGLNISLLSASMSPSLSYDILVVILIHY